MSQAAIKATPAPATTPRPAARYLSNEEAADFLKLNPRTLEKQRVIGGGPKFRKFGRRIVYAMDDLESWANAGLATRRRTRTTSP